MVGYSPAITSVRSKMLLNFEHLFMFYMLEVSLPTHDKYDYMFSNVWGLYTFTRENVSIARQD